MLTIFFVCLCLGTNVHAGVIATPTSTTSGLEDNTVTSAPFDEEAELKKIADTCFTYSARHNDRTTPFFEVSRKTKNFWKKRLKPFDSASQKTYRDLYSDILVIFWVSGINLE
ncbi:hypothetical protein B9Z55_026320 [Caenorhabditis nigoni]|uniref:Uncharacterized protein n=1 Tax=Caenorhabditis nigoni TaxID=1611254 RepID=A0A2G5T2K8_9PELO|nr:hypothetical protein B9Z55_026320 [Caenorhabditis nigoni]